MLYFDIYLVNGIPLTIIYFKTINPNGSVKQIKDIFLLHSASEFISLTPWRIFNLFQSSVLSDLFMVFLLAQALSFVAFCCVQILFLSSLIRLLFKDWSF